MLSSYNLVLNIKYFSSEFENKTKCPLSPLIFSTLPEVLANEISQEKEIKGWKGSHKAVIFLRQHGYICRKAKEHITVINN